MGPTSVWGVRLRVFCRHKRDLKNLEFHLLFAGHFALEEYGGKIAGRMIEFMDLTTQYPSFVIPDYEGTSLDASLSLCAEHGRY